MVVPVSGFGAVVSLIASNTYPTGIILTQFADDTDPFDVPSLQVADTAMGVNGDLIAFTKANPIKISLSVIPAGVSDTLLGILLEANRAGRGKISAQDLITIVVNYPQGNVKTFTRGIITDGMVANAISSAGRLKTKTYNFAFEAVAGA